MAAKLEQVLEKAEKYVQENKKTVAIAAGATTAALLAAYAWRRAQSAVPSSGPYPVGTLPADAYDAVIVGAGPSGSVCAYYLSRGGAKVAVLEKETFPRDKYCGDAVCTPAIRILEDMGVMQELIANNEAHFADAGGFVSPCGTSYIGVSKQKLGEAACCAVKRINLDMRIAKNAARAGADLKEKFEVSGATFDKATGLWSVTSTTGEVVKGRTLVCADGATSRLATKLGYCTEAPKGVCTRAFIEGGTHNTNFDGRKGDTMMAKWAEIMTNMQPKTYFLRPHVAIPLGIAVVREFINQKVLGTTKDRYQMLPKESA
ncbi:hypothetical protein GPECTOR_30g161 [Gonium pectorale]|uniref:FAD-binding domain-containing protein n=1 Tax=Gonium pectorale TaxID=33097 RepID=A0A150GE04_GONPE|nr:hypothetical protein GPECTOR_30g161 [Gonium pectorale]|eukprot:KXZ48066.1 hypothetical protein GPECTOR_30g161 [Gonium pectorale]